ncbi:MAG: hypothetical protein R6U39_06555 [Candidatus Aegiribacteria sp.]
MKYALLLTAAALILQSAVSCGGGEGDEVAEVPSENDAGSHLQLSVTDTIGVELGSPDYVFGHVVEAARDSKGNVLILDTSTMSVRKYSEQGEFLASAGRQGTGPGEFQMPMGLTVLGNNLVLVSDMGAGAVSVFSDSLQWRKNITGFFPRPPFTMTTAGDSAFVGMMPAFNREEGLRGYSIAKLDMDSEPSVVYAEEMRPFDPSMMGPQSDDDQPVFTSDNTGRVFIAWPGTDAVSVTGYLEDGEEYLSIEERIERVEKTPEELAAEREDFQEFTSRTGRRISRADASFDPVPYRRAVSELGVDSDGRLWVRLGTYRYPFWNVYSMDGELLFTASLELDDPDLDDMSVRITENGVAAWVPDPVTWPRVFVVEGTSAP